MHLLTFSLGFCVHLFYMREEENSAIYNRDVILLLLLLERYRENGMLQEKKPRLIKGELLQECNVQMGCFYGKQGKKLFQ